MLTKPETVGFRFCFLIYSLPTYHKGSENPEKQSSANSKAIQGKNTTPDTIVKPG